MAAKDEEYESPYIISGTKPKPEVCLASMTFVEKMRWAFPPTSSPTLVYSEEIGLRNIYKMLEPKKKSFLVYKRPEPRFIQDTSESDEETDVKPQTPGFITSRLENNRISIIDDDESISVDLNDDNEHCNEIDLQEFKPRISPKKIRKRKISARPQDHSSPTIVQNKYKRLTEESRISKGWVKGHASPVVKINGKCLRAQPRKDSTYRRGWTLSPAVQHKRHHRKHKQIKLDPCRSGNDSSENLNSGVESSESLSTDLNNSFESTESRYVTCDESTSDPEANSVVKVERLDSMSDSISIISIPASGPEVKHPLEHDQVISEVQSFRGTTSLISQVVSPTSSFINANLSERCEDITVGNKSVTPALTSVTTSLNRPIPSVIVAKPVTSDVIVAKPVTSDVIVVKPVTSAVIVAKPVTSDVIVAKPVTSAVSNKSNEEVVSSLLSEQKTGDLPEERICVRCGYYIQQTEPQPSTSNHYECCSVPCRTNSCYDDTWTLLDRRKSTTSLEFDALNLDAGYRPTSSQHYVPESSTGALNLDFGSRPSREIVRKSGKNTSSNISGKSYPKPKSSKKAAHLNIHSSVCESFKTSDRSENFVKPRSESGNAELITRTGCEYVITDNSFSDLSDFNEQIETSVQNGRSKTVSTSNICIKINTEPEPERITRKGSDYVIITDSSSDSSSNVRPVEVGSETRPREDLTQSGIVIRTIPAPDNDTQHHENNTSRLLDVREVFKQGKVTKVVKNNVNSVSPKGTSAVTSKTPLLFEIGSKHNQNENVKVKIGPSKSLKNSRLSQENITSGLRDQQDIPLDLSDIEPESDEDRMTDDDEELSSDPEITLAKRIVVTKEKQEKILYGRTKKEIREQERKAKKASKQPNYSYLTLKTIMDNRDAYINKRVNVYGAVTTFSAPFQSLGSDYVVNISITDESIYPQTIRCRLFIHDEAHLPQITNIGDVVRLHRLKIVDYHGELQAQSCPGFSCLVFKKDELVDLSPSSTTENYTWTSNDKIKVLALLKWAKDNITAQPTVMAPAQPVHPVAGPSVQPTPGTSVVRPAQLSRNEPVMSRTTISEAKHGKYINLICQIIGHRQLSNIKSVLRIWDGTKLPESTSCQTYSVEDCDEGLSFLAEGFSIDILVYDEHCQDLADLNPTDYVEITSLRVDRGRLTPTDYAFILNGGNRDKRGIHRLTPETLAYKQLETRLETVINSICP